MADNETIADIIAEMRGMGNYQRYSGDHARVLANRLEAAHKRERGDAAKLREALKAIGGLCTGLMPTWDGAIGRIKDIAEAALSAPPRNCDVGTAEEQDERFHRFCVKHHTGSCAGCHNPVGDYTVANGVRECALVWAQMPYEEGGAK
jgi:hypothetical protein